MSHKLTQTDLSFMQYAICRGGMLDQSKGHKEGRKEFERCMELQIRRVHHVKAHIL